MDKSALERESQRRLSDYFFSLTTKYQVEEGFALLDEYIRTLGFDAVAYSAMPVSIGAQGSFKPVFLTSRDYSRDFLLHYDEADLWQKDFTIERIQSGSLAIMDWQLELNRGILTADQQEVVNLATFEYGIKNAFTVPTQSDQHVVAGASVIAYMDRASFESISESNRAEAEEAIRVFHRYVFMQPDTASFFYQPLLSTLTETQKRVLAFIVTGKFQKHSKEYIGISPTRTGNVLSELYASLDVSNVSQLSYLAGIHHIVDMLDDV